MAFEDFEAPSPRGNGPKVDYAAMNEYVVDTADLKERTTLTGYISVIADLGKQLMEDAEVEFKGTAEDEAKAIAEKPNTYFKDGVDRNGKPVRLKCWPNRPEQCIAIAVDFPDIMLDKGKFFGEEPGNLKPLRMWLGGEFYMGSEIGSVVARPTALRVNYKLDPKRPSFDVKHVLYKMAVAANIIKVGELFTPAGIEKLLGKPFQFEVQIYNKPSKQGKTYYTEYVNFMGKLARGMKEPEVLTTPLVFELSKDKEPPVDPTKELRNHVINTMRRSINWEGSKIAEYYPDKKSTYSVKVDGDNGGSPQQQAAPEVKKVAVVSGPVASDDDDGAPF